MIEKSCKFENCNNRLKRPGVFFWIILNKPKSTESIKNKCLSRFLKRGYLKKRLKEQFDHAEKIEKSNIIKHKEIITQQIPLILNLLR